MDNKYLLTIIVAAIGAGVAGAQQRSVDIYESLYQRMVRASEADQLAYLKLRMNQGFRPLADDALTALRSRTSVFLPIVEQRIEEVLRSPHPQECFSDKAADPKYFVDIGVACIAQAGDEFAMKEIAKLVVIDKKRFGRLVATVLYSAINRRNPFPIAYKGLEIGNPDVDRQIITWAEEILGDEIEAVQRHYRPLWAEAMVEKYGDTPVDSKWADDPIASRIRPEIAEFVRKDVLRLAAEAREKQSKK